MGVHALCNLLLNAVKGTSADEEDVAGIDLHIVLVGVLASALWGYVDDGPFEEFEHGLLHTFSAHIARDAGVVALAGNLVDFVDEDDAALGFCYIVIRHLKEAREDAFDIFAHITCLGEDGGVNDGEGHIEELGNGARKEGFARTCGAHHDDVGLLDFYAVVGSVLTDALVVVIDGHGEVALCFVLADDILVEVRLDFSGFG